MHQELVERRRWISERRFLHALNYCMLLPGPEAQQLATYIGWLLHRGWGGVAAGALFVLPSFFLLVLLSWVYIAYGHLTWIAGLFYGIKPAVVAIVAQAAWRIGTRTLKRPWLWGVTLASLCAIAWWQTPFPLIVLAAALIGALAGRLRPHWFQAGGHGGADAHYGPALIDDHTRRRRTPASPGSGSAAPRWPACCYGPCRWRCSPPSTAGTAALPKWAGSSPRPPC